jgi:hypothetical protein
LTGLSGIQPPWYGKLETSLDPAQPAVYALSGLVILITLYMMIQPSRSLRTAWLVYLISP